MTSNWCNLLNLAVHHNRRAWNCGWHEEEETPSRTLRTFQYHQF